MIEKFEKVYVSQDESGHWYVIPYDLKEEFDKDLFDDDMVYNGDFDEKYAEYRTNGDINNIQLYVLNKQNFTSLV